MGWIVLGLALVVAAVVVLGIYDLVTDPPAGGWRNVFRRW